MVFRNGVFFREVSATLRFVFIGIDHSRLYFILELGVLYSEVSAIKHFNYRKTALY